MTHLILNIQMCPNWTYSNVKDEHVKFQSLIGVKLIHVFLKQ